MALRRDWKSRFSKQTHASIFRDSFRCDIHLRHRNLLCAMVRSGVAVAGDNRRVNLPSTLNILTLFFPTVLV